MFLNIVTNDELLTSQIVKGILLSVVAGGIIYNLFRAIRSKSGVNKTINLVFLIMLSLAFFFIFKQYRVEAALLNKPEYVQGRTIRYCNVFALGQGIEFEYEVDGRTFRNCNTFHPVSKDSITVPAGIYIVRYTQKFPGEGRMDFQKPLR